MRGMQRRLSTLEMSRSDRGWEAVLDAMCNPDLDRLDGLLTTLQAGRWSTVDDINDAEVAFLISVIATKEGSQCAI